MDLPVRLFVKNICPNKSTKFCPTRQGRNVLALFCFLCFSFAVTIAKAIGDDSGSAMFFNDIWYILNSVNIGSVAMVTYI